MSTTTTQRNTKGFPLLIKAPGVARHFTPIQGETITILDKDGRELWSHKLPTPINNPGLILQEVQIDPLTEWEFGTFCQRTWNRAHAEHSHAPVAPPSKPT